MVAVVMVLVAGAVLVPLAWWLRGSGPPPSQRLAAPAGLSVVSQSGSSVELAWDPVVGARGYDVYSDGGYVVSTSNEDVTVERLDAGSSAYWQVVATNSSGFSEKSPGVWVTLDSDFGSSGSGSSVPLGDLPGWRQVFVEDFDVAAPSGSFTEVYADRWGAYPKPWRDTSGRGIYSPWRTLSVAAGKLNIRVHSEGGQAYVAAPQPRLNGPGTSVWRGVLYGRFSIRFRADPVAGFKTAWLLWPDSGSWPGDGEIDFPEGSLDATIAAYAHFARPSGGMDEFDTGAKYTDWHVATIEWTPGRVEFVLDGAVIGTSTTHVPDQPMHFVLQTETELSGPAPAPDAAGNVEIDWFTAYAME